jgi:hypothetical protein
MATNEMYVGDSDICNKFAKLVVLKLVNMSRSLFYNTGRTKNQEMLYVVGC